MVWFVSLGSARRIVIIVSLLFARAAAQPAPAAQSFAPSGDIPKEFTIQKAIDEVTMVFTVRDRHGRFVSGLTQTDFDIQDRGQAPSRISFFQNHTDLPLRIAVAIDVSGSVSSRVKYEANVAKSFLERVVRPSDQAYVLPFNYRHLVLGDLGRAPDDVLRMHKAQPTAGTAVWDTVIAAAKLLSDAPSEERHRDVLLLITDGEDNASKASFDTTMQTVLNSGVVVLVLYTGGSNSQPQLKRMAESSGGRMFDGATLHGVVNGLAKAEQELRGQYVMAYRPPEFRADGHFRPVEIKALPNGLTVRARKGYYAVSGSQ